jgi:hypothetical protein
MWAGCATAYETEDALEYLLPKETPWEVLQALAEHLNPISVRWAERDEVDSRGDDDGDLDSAGGPEEEDSTFQLPKWSL